MKAKEVNGNIPDEMMVMSDEQVKQSKQELEEEKKKYPYISRNDYLKTLPQDEYGYPIVDRNYKGKFWTLARLHHWEDDFLEGAVSEGIIEAEGIPEFYHITEEYGV